MIRFRAKLFRPAEAKKGDSWTFLNPAQDRQCEGTFAEYDDG